MSKPRTLVENFSEESQPVVFAKTQRAFAHTSRSYPAFFMSRNSSSETSISKSLTNLPSELQAEIFSFARTVSVAKVLTICKEIKDIIESTHEGFRAARQGLEIQKETIGKLNNALKTKVPSLPLWLYTTDCDALELIGKEILDLTKLYEESINNPACFIEFIFDKRILLSLQKNLVSFDQIVDLLMLKKDPQANEAVYALFRSQECGKDILKRLGAVLSAEEELKASGVTVDKAFVAERFGFGGQVSIISYPTSRPINCFKSFFSF